MKIFYGSSHTKFIMQMTKSGVKEYFVRRHDLHCRFVGSKEEDEGEGEEKERGARAQSSGPPSISANMPASYSIDLNVHFSHARFAR